MSSIKKFKIVKPVYPQIRVDLSIFYPSPLDVVTNLLGEEPRKCKQTYLIPDPLYHWHISTKQSYCVSLEEKFDKMISMLGRRVTVLQQLVKDYELDVGFNGVVVMKNVEAPEIGLSKERIALLTSLNADFGVIIYRS